MDQEDLDYLAGEEIEAKKGDYTCPMCNWSGSRYDCDQDNKGNPICPKCGERLEVL